MKVSPQSSPLVLQIHLFKMMKGAVFYEDNKQIAESDDHFDVLEKVDEDDVHGQSRRAKLVDHHLVDQQNKVTSS